MSASTRNAARSGAAPNRDEERSLPVRWLDTVTGRSLAPYQTAVVRIGISLTWLCVLIREIPHRHTLYGPDSPWSMELAERALSGYDGFTVLMWSSSDLWFEVVYFLGIAASAAMLIGWRTRAMSVLVMVHVFSLQQRSPYVGDGGDMVLKLMTIYLAFVGCAQVWSLDARRRARAEERGRSGGVDITGIVLWALLGAGLTVATTTGDLDRPRWVVALWALWVAQAVWWAAGRWAAGEFRNAITALRNLFHNIVLLIMMFEVCLIYATSGWYKIQGSRWQDGTAVYYPMNVDDYAPWPEISNLLSGNWALVLLMTYGTVFVQVAFPFTLLNRRVKNVLLVCLIAEHVAIGVLMALPFFSMAMIAADIIFLPTAFLLLLDDRVKRLLKRWFPRSGRQEATVPAGRGSGKTSKAPQGKRATKPGKPDGGARKPQPQAS
ncbi:HTTM domain-containing protein [Streptomyces sp. DSM 44917]|uniref:HTTM domain-containing protein n=1 Tax=Streptomyces boetiae TaxID=3075541 RepID=A0ABU2L8S2_9ACTN|nr:HTTM domain-containing protein [Streptomyces sp. DSM 44917]MDT0307959.1 HTTM domain-containing protein [Streptomyces sp. DSM 44917]